MKMLQKVGITILTLLALVLIIALFVEKDYSVNRSVEISRKLDDVFNYVKFLEHQDEFSKWNLMDPDMKQTMSGEDDGKVGAIRSWDSDNDDVGAGEQEIIKIDENKRIDFELRFERPMRLTSNAYFITEGLDNGSTNVTWGIDGHVSWPWNFFNLFMDMDEALGPDLQEGLDNMKRVLEAEHKKS